MFQNCWEFIKCGREPGGSQVHLFGVCPAATDTNYDGVNHGKNGGRICWAVPGVLCKHDILGHDDKNSTLNKSCHFYRTVLKEEGIDFKLIKGGYIKTT